MNAVWIDSDMGFDDLAAVLTVQHSPGWSIEGLSLVAGNAPLDVVIDNALRAAACFDWRMPIHAGRDGPLVGALVTGQKLLGDDAMASAGRRLPSAQAELASRDGVRALGDWLRAASAPATVLALGPLTNVAALLMDDPAMAPRIGQLVWMGGSAGAGNVTAAAEFNAAVDPESIEVVLQAGVPLRMVGLDACRQVDVDADDARRLRAIGTERAELLADLLLGYVRIATHDGRAAMPLYDPSAAAALVAPGTMQFRPAHVAAECKGDHTRGMTVVEWRVPARAEANALVADVVDSAGVRRVVLDALARAAA